MSLESRNSAKNNVGQEEVGSFETIRETTKTYFHTIIFSAGTYLAFPMLTLQSTFVVLSGVGILITTLFALSFGGKFALTWTV